MLQRALIALGAVAIAGIAVFGMGRRLDRWRKANVEFEFPLEDLFI
jgi:hypothetical protein